ncbi:hypothetical protein Tco_0890383 [Tanacetum coccineum]|uniref:Uncharacterized protein n=1 Tax=Tanacetum coccineum TaxID=301880 RepID=A0ABQ5C399_9ASTR
MDSIKPRVLAPDRYAIDVEPIPPRNRNNREVYLNYLKHLKESVETFREIVEESKVETPLDRSLASACLYTKHSQELLEYVIDTCPKDFNQRDKKQATTPLTRKKKVTFEDQCETICKKKLVNSVEIFKLCVLDSLVSWLFLSPSLFHSLLKSLLELFELVIEGAYGCILGAGFYNYGIRAPRLRPVEHRIRQLTLQVPFRELSS